MSYIARPTKSYELGETISAGTFVDIIENIAYTFTGAVPPKIEGVALESGTIGQTKKFLITSIKI